MEAEEEQKAAFERGKESWGTVCMSRVILEQDNQVFVACLFGVKSLESGVNIGQKMRCG